MNSQHLHLSLISVITLCFYGLSFNSGKLELFVGTGLMAGVECLAYVIILFTIDIADRRPVLAFCQILGGVSCVAAGFVPEQLYWVRLGLALVGKMGASAAFGVVFLYTGQSGVVEVEELISFAFTKCYLIGG